MVMTYRRKDVLMGRVAVSSTKMSDVVFVVRQLDRVACFTLRWMQINAEDEKQAADARTCSRGAT